MKALAVLSVGGLLWTVGGCMGQADGASSANDDVNVSETSDAGDTSGTSEASQFDAVVEFYDTRFNIGFTRQEKSDLVAFLRSL
jgi:hypothetical protein